MKKSDLKNGMVVEIKGGLYFLIDDVFVGIDEFMPLDRYTNELKLPGDSEFDITKVFEVICWGSGFEFILNNKKERLMLLWERKQEIDWNKVPKGTVINVRASERYEWEERELLAYLGEDLDEDFNRFVVRGAINGWLSFRYATIENPKQEWLK